MGAVGHEVVVTSTSGAQFEGVLDEVGAQMVWLAGAVMVGVDGRRVPVDGSVGVVPSWVQVV